MMRAPIPLKRGLTVATALGAAFALSSCEDEAAQPGSPATPPPAQVVTAPASGVAATGGLAAVPDSGRSKHFDAVASHLHLGGEVFAYLDVDGDVEKLAGMIQGIMKKAPAGELPPHIEQLDLSKVLGDIGLDGIEAIGVSSYKDGGRYHNRAFLYVPQGRKGLLKIVGGDAGPFVSHSLAPADSDLVIEQTINLAAAYEVASKMVLHFGGEEGYADFRGKMGEVNPQFGLSVAELLGKLDTRLTVVARVHPDKPLAIPDAPVEVPSFDFLIALDDLGWLYEKVTGNLKAEMPADQVAQMFVKGDGFEKIALPPMPSPDMVLMQPVIHHDIANKRVYLASTQAFLDECVGGQTKLADSADFKAASAGLPAEGNGLSYVSSGLMKAGRKLYEEAIGAAAPGGGRLGAQETAILSLLSAVFPSSDQGQAKVSVNQRDGILVSSNSTTSVKDGIVMVGVSYMAAFVTAFSSIRPAGPDAFDQAAEIPQQIEAHEHEHEHGDADGGAFLVPPPVEE